MSNGSYDIWAVVVMVACAFVTRAGYMPVGSYLP